MSNWRAMVLALTLGGLLAALSGPLGGCNNDRKSRSDKTWDEAKDRVNDMAKRKQLSDQQNVKPTASAPDRSIGGQPVPSGQPSPTPTPSPTPGTTVPPGTTGATTPPASTQATMAPGAMTNLE